MHYGQIYTSTNPINQPWILKPTNINIKVCCPTASAIASRVSAASYTRHPTFNVHAMCVVENQQDQTNHRQSKGMLL
jgi:hypothetical protein